MEKSILIVGAGFSGAVLAHELSTRLHNKRKIVVWDERNHVAGNCHTQRDPDTGVMIHEYGPHIFHTSNKKVWDYVNSFVPFEPFVNRVKAVFQGQIYSMPINLHTINQFFGKTFNPKEAADWIGKQADTSITEPKSFEEQAIRFLGKSIYKAFFYGYTKKQWGCEPTELPASILKRLPVRFNYNDNYYNDVYQGIPRDGYTAIIEKMFRHDNIKLELGKKYIRSEEDYRYEHIFFSGPIDQFFGYKHGRLSYRTVTFERHETEGDFQGNPVINYCDEDVPYTRIHEHKHFTPWETHEKTVFFKEFSKETTETDIPYYPKRLSGDMEILQKYEEEKKSLENISFLGRLATYRYLDMHQVIEEALEVADSYISQHN
ncbi:UDP-galactopyranose mutase [Leptospira idonii]|uniref:UDP-galactopyranose mutase n=1 Tax=Leptospira idonii TaxID=1193500 RepID=A0A4R9LVT1_9LEPT|nr:UDP-galactopyranose mutase [Leptospira idonii]TGN18310.1 UDP-galactopyranose mutase [Leptospira idonii]